MGFYFSKHLMLRMPVFPTAQYQMALSNALKDPIFQAAVYLASPQFYDRLQKAGFDTGKMTAKECYAASRYFNRACFRPTPFGYFSSITMGQWQSEEHIEISAPSLDLSAYVQPAEWFLQTLNKLEGVHKGDQAMFEPNPTLYRVNKNFRFLKADIGESNRRTYQLQSSLYSQVLSGILKYCKSGQRRRSIVERICREANCDLSEGIAYFEFLQDAQILLPIDRPSITGHIFHSNTLSQELRGVLFNRSKTMAGHLPSAMSLKEGDQFLLEKIPERFRSTGKSLFNLILVRDVQHKFIDEAYQEDLRKAIFALDRLSPPDQMPALSTFKAQFIKHFEGERIPLLLALDPELGIGYQSEPHESPNPLLETINLRPRSRVSDKRSWTAAHHCLMAAWLKMERQQANVIDLEFADLNSLKEKKDELILGASILFQLSEAGVYVESTGGNNPAALIGRFTMADERTYQAGLDIAAAIENKNPDLLFAEILHLADPHIDNVNRRRQLWNYQLPILAAADPVDKSKTLELADLYVQVLGGMIVLWSKTHNKIVVPRLTSAYNHGIDELPLFRFLADISYQYGRTQLSFDLNHYFPGFPSYPRVTYLGVILSPATWIISPDELEALLLKKDWITAFKQTAKQLGVSDRFIVTEGDQQLVFDQTVNDELVMVRELIRPRQKMILREYLAPKYPSSVNRSGSDKVYQVQFNAFLLPDTSISLPRIDNGLREYPVYQRKFIPGTEWLYLKLYVPRLAVNRLLLQLQPIVRKRFPHGKITQWFFVRFEDHAPHIRIRFKVDPRDVDEILKGLRSILEENVHQHLIREFQLDVYSREIERYQALGIEETEEFFSRSSNFVVQYLRVIKSGITLPAFLVAAYSVKAITEGFLKEASQREVFWQQSFERYAHEFEVQKLKVELDQKYRETSRQLDLFLEQAEPFQNRILKRCFHLLKSKAAELGRKLLNNDAGLEYLLSVLHLHLNRIFADRQREQEMVIYYLLAKWMRSQEARQKKQPKVSDLF
jgi:thiopeptide-type bacteriocin biosynthesis protein